MAEAGQVTETTLDEIRGYVHVFAVPELSKGRRRAIKHTKDINDAFGRETLVPARLPTRAEQSRQAASGDYAISVDFAAYFDQFPMDDEVRRLMAFRSGGKVWLLARMPMGQRHAVAVAQAATNVLLSFPMPSGVTSQSCIDNVRFVGSKQGVTEAARMLLRRCASAGVTVNEVAATDDVDKRVRELVHQQGTWLGAEYDYRHKRQRVAEKSMVKLSASWKRRGEWTHRQYAAHVGLLFFCSGVLRAPMASYFDALKQLRERSARLTEDSELWAKAVALQPAELIALTRWTEFCAANRWVRCDDDTHPTRFVITDASAWGWGAIHFLATTGAVESHSEEWSETDKRSFDVGKSTQAEPEAVLRALRRFCRSEDRGSVGVLTDSTTARFSLDRGYSASFAVNAIAARVRAEFPHLRLVLRHIPGTANPADGLSRSGPQLGTGARELARACVAQAMNGGSR